MKSKSKILTRTNHFKTTTLGLAVWIATTHYGHTAQATSSEAIPHINASQYELELERQRQMIIQQEVAIKQLKDIVEALSVKMDRETPAKVYRNKIESSTKESIKAKASPVAQKQVGRPPPIDVSVIPKLSTNTDGVLTKTGALIIEPAISYSYTDNYRVFLDAFSFIPALVVGLIDLREVKRHSLVASITTRYGITDRWEFDVKIPYVGRNDNQRSRPISVGVSEDEIFNASGGGLGDIELSSRYQLNSAGDGGPIYVANLVATIPTGTSPFDVEFVQSTPGAVFPTELPTGSGYASVQPSLTAIYPTDPGVFFGNLNYGYNMETDEEVGKVDPGDSAGISFGLGFSLNERTSMSLSYSHKHVLKSKIDDVKINGSELDIGQLIIGYSFRYSQQTNINLSLAVGVTDDAQNIRLNFRLPIMF